MAERRLKKIVTIDYDVLFPRRNNSLPWGISTQVSFVSYIVFDNGWSAKSQPKTLWQVKLNIHPLLWDKNEYKRRHQLSEWVYPVWWRSYSLLRPAISILDKIRWATPLLSNVVCRLQFTAFIYLVQHCKGEGVDGGFTLSLELRYQNVKIKVS